MNEPVNERDAEGVGVERQPAHPPGEQGGRRKAAEKLARRLAGLPAGRYELVITINDDGVLTDWSVRRYGKVERP